MSDIGWNTYLQGRKSYDLKHLTICKKNKMNICRVCEAKFFISANKVGACKVTGLTHDPKYDFTLSDNVLECEDFRDPSQKVT